MYWTGVALRYFPRKPLSRLVTLVDLPLISMPAESHLDLFKRYVRRMYGAGCRGVVSVLHGRCQHEIQPPGDPRHRRGHDEEIRPNRRPTTLVVVELGDSSSIISRTRPSSRAGAREACHFPGLCRNTRQTLR